MSGCIGSGVSSAIPDVTITNLSSTDLIIKTATERLSPEPERFDLVKRNFYDSQIDDFTRIDEAIWKRPEFYPTWERSGITNYINHDYTRWAVFGYGFFPGEQSWTARNMTEGDTLTYHTFLHTSWGVETWQGMRLQSIHNETLFDVTITPNEFYLEPTYPIFWEDWTRIITITVTAKTNPPKGTYMMRINVVEPNPDRTEEWSWEILDKFSDGKYQSEIERCKSDADCEECEELLKMRQNKYVAGNMFQPDTGFVSYVTVM